MLKNSEVNFIMTELLTATTLKKDIYRQQINGNLSIVYYVLDPIALEKGIFRQIYFSEKELHIFLGNWKKAELFKKALQNTVRIHQISCITFAEYLRNLGMESGNIGLYAITMAITDRIENIEKEHQPFSITGANRFKSAIGALSPMILKKICRQLNINSLIIGICNNDFALIFQNLPENIPTMKKLMKICQEFKLGGEPTSYKIILKYDVCTGILVSIDENI